MANLEELVVTLTAETSGLKAELEAAAKTTRQQLAKMQGSLDELSNNSKKKTRRWSTSKKYSSPSALTQGKQKNE